MRTTLIATVIYAMGLPACAGKDEESKSTGDSDGGTTASGSSSSGDSGSTGGRDTSESSSGSESGSSASGSTSGSGSTTEAPFIVMPDGDQTNAECDIWAQDCVAGKKCMPWANDGFTWNATKCTDVDPMPKQVGDECNAHGSAVSGFDDCDVGSMCWNVDVNGVGYCVGFCEGSASAPTCPDRGERCTIYNSGVLPLCLLVCDPLTQDCPTTRDVCVPSGDNQTFNCVPDASGMAGNHGDPCEAANVCKAGLFCGAAMGVPNCTGAVGCCTQFCDLSLMDASQCMGAPEGQECVAWFDPAMVPPEYVNLGACVIP